MTACSDRRGYAPPIKHRSAVTENLMPRRLYRTRRRNAVTPPGAVYVGRPTLWGNPFAARPKIGHARSVILYSAWIDGHVSRHVLECCGFSPAEIAGMYRWRARLMDRIDQLAGRDLQCWCPLTSDWCHADILLRVANSPLLATQIGKAVDGAIR
ncbi:MAG TPA: DUF4326 domain-containing protein [Sphingomonas sp.]